MKFLLRPVSHSAPDVRYMGRPIFSQLISQLRDRLASLLTSDVKLCIGSNRHWHNLRASSEYHNIYIYCYYH